MTKPHTFMIVLFGSFHFIVSSSLTFQTDVDPVQQLADNDCNVDLTGLKSQNASLSAADRSRLAYSLAQCHWQTMDRPWVIICNEDSLACLSALPDVALADWILHWTLVSKAERHVKSTLRQYTARVISIDGERLSHDISQSQALLSNKITALVDGADKLLVKHSQFAAQFTEFMTRLTPLRALVQSVTRAVTHISALIDALSAHHARLLYLFWLSRTVFITRVLRMPFIRAASCLGAECRVNFSRVTDGLLFVQLFVLNPLLHIRLSFITVLLMHVMSLWIVYLCRTPTQEVQTKPEKESVVHSDWSNAKLSLYRQLKHCSDLRARVKMRREWTSQQRSIIRHLPGHVSSDSSL